MPESKAASRWYVPRSFTVGKGRKVHVGVRRRGPIIHLGCGMTGVAGSDWLVPTDDPFEPVTCGHCLRSVNG